MIDKVEKLAVMEKQTLHISSYLIFKWMPGREIEDLQIEENKTNEVDQANGKDEQQPNI